jgi:hypothetical protein
MFPVLLCLVVSLVGLVIFALVADPPHSKLSRVSFAMFWVGMLAFLMRFSYIGASVR